MVINFCKCLLIVFNGGWFGWWWKCANAGGEGREEFTGRSLLSRMSCREESEEGETIHITAICFKVHAWPISVFMNPLW